MVIKDVKIYGVEQQGISELHSARVGADFVASLCHSSIS